jgi:hypothetical protein
MPGETLLTLDYLQKIFHKQKNRKSAQQIYFLAIAALQTSPSCHRSVYQARFTK